jgi:phage-related protein
MNDQDQQPFRRGGLPAIYVLHAFEKKTQKTSAHDLRIGRERFRALAKLRQHNGKEERG